MLDPKSTLAHDCAVVIKDVFDVELPPDGLLINSTPQEFEGDYSLVVFPLVKQLRQKPEDIARQIGERLVSRGSIVAYNVVKGFLNCLLHTSNWLHVISNYKDGGVTSPKVDKPLKVVVEYSSPNTNKPLHLGHIRNMFLGWSVAKIKEEVGHQVTRVQIINDRGIAICKSMLAWQLFGENRTPKSEGVKGDHFVGDYYVLFETKFKEEYALWQQNAGKAVLHENRKENEPDEVFFKRYKNQYFNDHSALGKGAKDMLQKWEREDVEIRQLWSHMNGWVYKGFDETYSRLGVNFDKNYYESDTFILGKDIVAEGLASDVFYQKEDKSVWIDLEERGLDHKLLLRSDGTSVYITQDLGTADQRYDDLHFDEMVYVTADEQNYHFKALFETVAALGRSYASGMRHLSYGMVELPDGKMKSREGTVVDADDLIAEVVAEAGAIAKEKGEISSFSEDEQRGITDKIGLAALKFYMIKVSPKKKMIFDPKESVDLHGQTGPYIQNAYVRIQSLISKAKARDLEEVDFTGINEISTTERDLIRFCGDFNEVLMESAEKCDPSAIANYCYQLAKMYHRFYSDAPILIDEGKTRTFRLILSQMVGAYLKRGMSLLGIDMPNRM